MSQYAGVFYYFIFTLNISLLPINTHKVYYNNCIFIQKRAINIHAVYFCVLSHINNNVNCT